MTRIKQIDISFFLFILINATFMLIGSKTFIKLNNINSLIVIIIGTIIGYYFINYFKFLLNKKKITNNKFILLFSNIISLLLIVNSSNYLNNFISYNLLPHMNTYIISISFLLLACYLATKKIDVFIKLSGIFIFIFTIIFIFTLLSLINYINFKELTISFKKIEYISLIKGITLYIITTISPCFYLFFINSDEYKYEINKTYIMTSLFILINIIMIIGILGFQLIDIYNYPEITILKKVSFLNIINRLENILSINIFFCIFLFISINYYVFIETIRRFFKLKKENLTYIISFLIIFILINRLNINLYTLISLLIGLLIIPIINNLIIS